MLYIKEKKMKNLLYSYLNDDTTRSNIEIVKKMNLDGLIVDFDCKEDLCSFLQKENIKNNYYRIKLYYMDIDYPDYLEIEKEIKKAKDYGFHGFAIDAEPYSGSRVWQKDPKKALEFGEWLGKSIKKHFDTVMVYPENLGGTKYFNYDAWYRGLVTNSELKVKLLSERTYEVWKPWELSKIYNKIIKEQKITGNIEIILGIWYESMADFKFISEPISKKLGKSIEAKDIKGIEFWTKIQKIFDNTLFLRKLLCVPCQALQCLYTTLLFKRRFYYTETTDFLKSWWLRFLSN
jgi:hypothetical protein